MAAEDVKKLQLDLMEPCHRFSVRPAFSNMLTGCDYYTALFLGCHLELGGREPVELTQLVAVGARRFNARDLTTDAAHCVGLNALWGSFAPSFE